MYINIYILKICVYMRRRGGSATASQHTAERPSGGIYSQKSSVYTYYILHIYTYIFKKNLHNVYI